jgi:AsmA protein
VALAPFNLRKLMRQFKMDVPETADKQALSKVALSTEFDGSGSHLNLDKLALTLDGSSISGKLGVTDFEKQALQADLKVDRINLDDYLPPEAQNQPATPETAAGAAAQLPVETLRSVNARVDLKAGALTLSRINLTDLVLHLEGKDGRIRLDPMKANLYEGSYQGRINLDATGKQPKLDMESTLAGVQIAPLLKDVTEAGQAQMQGSSYIDARLGAAGNSTEAMKRNLNGNIDLRVDDGVLVGVDVRKVLEQAEIILESKRITRIDRGERTPFERLTATLNIKSGIVSNDDLLITSPGFQITGKGTVANLRNETVNYDMKVEVVK